MAFAHLHDRVVKSYIPVIPSATTTSGELTAGVIVYMSSNSGYSAISGTAGSSGSSTDANIQKILGIVKIASTAGSTTPAYIAPILPGEVIVADLSTTLTGIVSSNIGCFFKAANSSQIDGSTALTTIAATDNAFLQMTGFSTKEYKIWGIIPARLLGA